MATISWHERNLNDIVLAGVLPFLRLGVYAGYLVRLPLCVAIAAKLISRHRTVHARAWAPLLACARKVSLPWCGSRIWPHA